MIERFDVDEYGDLREFQDGKFVRYSDHAAEVERLKARVLSDEVSSDCPFCEAYAVTGHAQQVPMCCLCTMEALRDTLTAENAALKEEVARCSDLCSIEDGGGRVSDVLQRKLTTARARIAELEGVIQGFREHMVAAVIVGEIDKEEREYIIGILDGCVAKPLQNEQPRFNRNRPNRQRNRPPNRANEQP